MNGRIIRFVVNAFAVVALSAVSSSSGQGLSLQPDLPSQGIITNSRALTGPPAPDSPRDATFARGLQLQQQAEASSNVTERSSLLRKAVSEFQQAGEAKPDSYSAQLVWAHCLAKLAQSTPDEKERRTVITAARQRFAAAARCTGEDWRVYYDWGVLLLSQADFLTTRAEPASRILDEAKKLLEKSLPMTVYTGDKAAVNREMAMCMIAIAEHSDDTKARPTLYREAAARFETAASLAPKAMAVRFYGLWGVSLLQAAKIDNDRMMIRQSVERLLTALEMDSSSSEIRYNLVCAYALLDEPDNAMRHLRLCLDNDPKRVFFKAAANDPDLWSLRRTPEYNQIFKADSTQTGEALSKPRISDR